MSQLVSRPVAEYDVQYLTSSIYELLRNNDDQTARYISEINNYKDWKSQFKTRALNHGQFKINYDPKYGPEGVSEQEYKRVAKQVLDAVWTSTTYGGGANQNPENAVKHVVVAKKSRAETENDKIIICCIIANQIIIYYHSNNCIIRFTDITQRPHRLR